MGSRKAAPRSAERDPIGRSPGAGAAFTTEAALPIEIPLAVREIMATLWRGGHSAYVVGGCLRDALIGREPADWDLTTDAAPERIAGLFPRALYENRFGTVVVRQAGSQYEVTTFRRDVSYSDFRHPDSVEFAGSLEDDLARRDFTVNAIAWGAPADLAQGRDRAGAEPGTAEGDEAGDRRRGPLEPAAAEGDRDRAGLEPPATEGADPARLEPGAAEGGRDRGGLEPAAAEAGNVAKIVDPHGGRADIERRLLRAVGDPDARFREDALRMLRAVRLAAALEFDVEAETLEAIGRNAALAAHVSGERIAAELAKLLAAPRPSVGLRLMADTGLLDVIFPELASQRGIGQNKIEGEDLWDHTLRSVDAAPNRPIVRLAALLHDVGKPDTLSDGHFLGHDRVGARMSVAILSRIHAPRALQERVGHLVANHMFSYQENWSDAAVRRFIRKVGSGAVDDLLDLRAADNVGSGQQKDAGGIEELRTRIDKERMGRLVLHRNQLAANGRDLMAELGLGPGKQLGAILDELTERVVAEPALNDREILLELARGLMDESRMSDNPES